MKYIRLMLEAALKEFKETRFLIKTSKSVQGSVGRALMLVFRCLWTLIKAFWIVLSLGVYAHIAVPWRAAIPSAALIEFILCNFQFEYYKDGSIEQKIKTVAEAFALVVSESLVVFIFWLLVNL